LPKADLPKLIEGAYAAALDDSLWYGWSERMISEFGAQGALFWVVDTSRRDIRRSYVIFPKADVGRVLDEYYGGLIDFDFRLKKVAHSKASEIFSDRDGLEHRYAEADEFVGWQLDRTKTRHYLAATVVLGEGLKVGVSVHRTPAAGAFNAADRRQIETMFGQFGQAVRLGVQHNRLLQEAWWEGVQSQSRDAAFLIDERGKVLRVSTEAERALGALGIKGGRLCASDPSANAALQAAVSKAIEPSGAVASSVRVPAGEACLQLIVSPLSRERRFLAPFEAAAIVHLIDPAAAKPVDGAAISALFGLTPAEARLAAALAAGDTISEAAARYGVAVGTVRTQLKSIFGKMGVNRQQDLILRLSSLR
jgi:DNA-binding CsgD family transcriptional regulator/PAS domain-containing protein